APTRKLHAAGMLSFRRRARCFVGAFTAIKKDGYHLHPVLDCRPANVLHKELPVSQLATAAALGSMSLREGEAMVDEHTLHGRPLDVHFSGADRADGYFQFEFEEVAGYFCLPRKIVAADYEVKRVHDDDLERWVDVGGGRVVAEMTRLAEPDRDKIDARILRDCMRVPALQPGLPALAPYVDNAFLICWGRRDALEAFASLLDDLRRRGFVWRNEVQAEEVVTQLGLLITGGAWPIVTHKSERLSADVASELKVAAGLVLIVRHHFRLNTSTTVHCPDASQAGYSVHVGRFNPGEVLPAIAWKERWRFRTLEAFVEDDDADPGPWSSIAAESSSLAPSFESELGFGDLDVNDLTASSWKASSSRWASRRAREWIDAHAVPALGASFSDRLRWRRVVVGGWCKPEAIHNKEARASLLGLRRHSRRVRRWDSELLSAGGNLSETLAMERGRAKDRELNALRRRS
ncbi:unnamed protein product, partial [Prorocentrum cordatum]